MRVPATNRIELNFPGFEQTICCSFLQLLRLLQTDVRLRLCPSRHKARRFHRNRWRSRGTRDPTDGRDKLVHLWLELRTLYHVPPRVWGKYVMILLATIQGN